MKASIRVALGTLSISLSAAAQDNTNLSSGGLAPPPAIESESDQEAKRQETERDLERAEKEDSGRGLEFFWMNAEFGAEHVGLQTLNASDLVDDGVIDTTQTGIVFGGGLGVRLIFFTLGARFRYAPLPDYRLWTLNGEAALHVPLGPLEPYFTFGAGYASLGGFADENLDRAGASAGGFDIRLGAGLDVYLSEVFSIGGNLTGEMLYLSRSALDASDIAASAGALAPQVYSDDGSSIGAAGTLTLVAGLHF